MATTHQQHPAGGTPSTDSAPPDALAVATTLVALRLVAAPETRLQLDVPTLAGLLWPQEDPSTAADRMVLHLLTLEAAGEISTGIGADGTEWITLDAGPFSMGVSESARARASGRERVRERAGAGEPRERPPARPWFMDAPPIGCPDHPRGYRFPCGACRTFRLRHEQFMMQGRARAQLEQWESVYGPVEQWDPDSSGGGEGVLFDDAF